MHVVLAMAFLFSSIPGALAEPQNDAGTGGDAPDAFAEAVTVSVGSYEGRLDSPAGDHADWYRVTTAGALRFTFAAIQEEVRGSVFTENGTLLKSQHSFGDPVVLRTQGPGTFLVQFMRNHNPGAMYRFELASVRPQDDAGCLCDAPDTPEFDFRMPSLRTAGTFAGNLSPEDGDVEDWYHASIDAPWFRLQVDGTDVEVMLHGVRMPTPVDVRIEPAAFGKWGILAAGPEAGGYVFSLEPAPMPDLRVLEFTVAPAYRETPAGRMEGDSHVFTVTVDNVGQIAGEAGGSVTVWTRGSTTDLSLERRALTPGESTTWTVEWHTLGHVGRYAAYASVMAGAFDENRRDNRATLEEWVLVRAPIGV